MTINWRLVGAVMVAPALLSAVLWTVFGVRWWVPFDEHDLRAPALAMLHIASIFVGAILCIEGTGEGSGASNHGGPR